MTRIIQGVLDFQQRIFGKKRTLFEKLGAGQQPLALFITCSDSRINPDLLAQTEPGELFVLRNAGNLVPPFSAGCGAEAATIEYAVLGLRVRDIILCGHSKCGAMHGLLEPHALAAMPSVGGWLAHAQDVLPRIPENLASEEERLARAVEENVLVQMEHLRGHPSVASALAARTLRLRGWVYHFELGKVDSYDPIKGRFVPLDQQVRPRLLEDASKEVGPRTEWDTRI